MNKPYPVITRNEFFNLPESERPKFGLCEKHGEFEIKFEDKSLLKVVMSTCPKCSEAYQEFKKLEAFNKKKEADLKLYNEKIQLMGVSKRHFNKTFESYIPSNEDQAFALESFKYFAETVIKKTCKNMIICGGVGVGKTHLAMAVCQYLAKHDLRHISACINTVTEIIRHFRASYSNDCEYTEQDSINKFSFTDLLVIDELGTSKGDDKELNILFEIINNRYEKKLPTLILSNLSIEEVKALLGDRMIDRLKEDGCRVLGVTGESYRSVNKEEFNNIDMMNGLTNE